MKARLAALVAALAAASAFAAPHYADLTLSDSRGGAEKRVFQPGTAKIYLHATLVDVARGSVVKSEWIAEKTKVAPPNYRMDGTELKIGPLINSVDFNMSKPTKGWPPGDYRVDLFIDGKRVEKVKYQVK